jgi:hypothetical protein
MFHQLSAYLAFLDLISAVAWFIGPKYDTSYEMCSIQEYLFQGSLLCKGLTTVVICLLSWRVIYTMQIPSVGQVFLSLFVGNLVAIFCLLISIFFQSSKIFCVDLDLHDVTQGTLIGYLYFNLLPLYLCVLLDLFFYLLIRFRLYQQDQQQAERQQTQGRAIDQSLFDQNQKLLRVVQRMLFYPLLFALFLVPEALLVLLNLFSVHSPFWLLDVSAACMGLLGTAVALNYFYRQSDSPSSSSSSFFGLFWGRSSSSAAAPLSPAAVVMGRNLSSILWWGSSTRPGSESTIGRQTMQVGTEDHDGDEETAVAISLPGTMNPLTGRRSLQVTGRPI